MSGSTKRILSIFISVLFLIGAAAVYSSFIQSAYEEIGKKRGELSSKKAILEQDRFYVEQVKKIIAEYQKAQEFSKNLSRILPVSENVPEALNQIISLAEINGLRNKSLSSKIAAIEPSESKLIKGTGAVNFDVKLAGNYESFKAFLGNLETNVRIMDIGYLIIEPEGESGRNNLVYSLTVDAYYQTQQ